MSSIIFLIPPRIPHIVGTFTHKLDKSKRHGSSISLTITFIWFTLILEIPFLSQYNFIIRIPDPPDVFY